MLSVILRALSRALNKTLIILDTKVDGISGNIKHIKDDVSLVGNSVVRVSDTSCVSMASYRNSEVNRRSTRIVRYQCSPYWSLMG